MILLPKSPKIIDKKGNWARFEIEGLYPGYGITIGNALRRVLVSSLNGAAVTQVRIKGVQHEFSTVPGVLEDVITIMMNLKKMRFKVHSDEPQEVSLSLKGEREAKGSDFNFPSQVELVNGSCHIATLTDKKAELEMEIKIERGIGYRPVEQGRGGGKSSIGTLPLDAIFTPVQRVNYRVENMRVGERTDFDRLYLEITTDGTIEPERALSQASSILVRHFSIISEAFPEEDKPQAEPKKEKKTKKEKLEQGESLAKEAKTKKEKAKPSTAKKKKAQKLEKDKGKPKKAKKAKKK